MVPDPCFGGLGLSSSGLVLQTKMDILLFAQCLCLEWSVATEGSSAVFFLPMPTCWGIVLSHPHGNTAKSGKHPRILGVNEDLHRGFLKWGYPQIIEKLTILEYVRFC